MLIFRGQIHANHDSIYIENKDIVNFRIECLDFPLEYSDLIYEKCGIFLKLYAGSDTGKDFANVDVLLNGLEILDYDRFNDFCDTRKFMLMKII